MGRFTPILCLFWPLGCPKLGKIFEYGQNGFLCQISYVEYHMRPNLQVSIPICGEMGMFTPFCAPFDPWGAQKWVKYSSMVKMISAVTFLMLNIICNQICRFLSLFVRRWARLPHSVPLLTPGVPKNGSNIRVWWKWFPLSIFSCWIAYLSKILGFHYNF